MAAGIEQVWNDDTVRLDLIRKGSSRAGRFTWEQTAWKTLELYRRISETS
jgi:hypothetical protein